MRDDRELLARAMSHIDDRMILAARRPHKKLRRWIPVAVAACLVVAVWQVYPYLRQVINTDLVLGGPAGETLPEADEGILTPNRPDEKDIIGQHIPAELGAATITVTNVTEDTVTLRIVKTDSAPIYAALYDLLGYPLATTEADYRVEGVVIQSNQLKLLADGDDGYIYSLPQSKGSHEIVLDFSSVRHGDYPMLEHIGLYAYIGENGESESIFFSLAIPEDTTTGEGIPID